MKLKLLWCLTLLLTSCADDAMPLPSDLPEPPLPPAADRTLLPAPHRATAPIVAPPRINSDSTETEVAALSPKQVITAAGLAKRRADGYVGWSGSAPDNVDRMTTLVIAMDNALAAMKASEVKGVYSRVEVMAARRAVRDLQVFLETKKD